MIPAMAALLERHWYRLSPVSLILLPLSLLFGLLVAVRRRLYRLGLFSSQQLPVPVIVIGNITVGGTGKTPLVIWLAGFLRQAGYAPGIITRGYRGRSRSWPLRVTPTTAAAEAGDEAVLLARRSGCPVMAGPDRVADARQLLDLGCNVILSDDGLQHYALARNLEIAVIDGVRRFGNGLCLPAGPLREPVSRLRAVTAAVTNGVPQAGEFAMQLEPRGFYSLQDPAKTADAGRFRGQTVHAVAGIGHPERFFASLRALGLDIVPHGFPDHHAFRAEDLDFGDRQPVILTEKDAVKCEMFAQPQHWVLAVAARPDELLGRIILQHLKETTLGQETA